MGSACGNEGTEDRRDALLGEHPAEGGLAGGLSLGFGIGLQLQDVVQEFGREAVGRQVRSLCHARVGRDAVHLAVGAEMAVQVAVGEQSLCQGREGNEANALFAAEGEDARVHRLAVDEVEAALIDEQGHVVLAQRAVGDLQGLERPARDADVERLACSDDVDQRLQRLLERRRGVVAVAVEEVDVVQVHAPEALVEACHEVLAGAPVAVGPGPHVVAGLRADEELVAVGTEVVIHEAAHRLLGRAVRRAVVVGEVEVCDAVVESVARDVAAALVGVHAAEVVPEAEADLGQEHAAVSAALVQALVGIAPGGGKVFVGEHIIGLWDL